MATLGWSVSARKVCGVYQYPDSADGCQDSTAADRDKSMETMLDMILILGKENKSLKLEVRKLHAELHGLKMHIKDATSDGNAIHKSENVVNEDFF